MQRASTAEAALPPALSLITRQISPAELAVLHVASVSLILVACIGCTVYRNRRRNSADLRAAEMLAAFEQVTEPTTPRRIAKRPPRIRSFHAPKAVGAASCPICLELLADLPISAGPCQHNLHTACLVQWLGRDPHMSCPVCRGTYETSCEGSVDGELRVYTSSEVNSGDFVVGDIVVRQDRYLNRERQSEFSSELLAPTDIDRDSTDFSIESVSEGHFREESTESSILATESLEADMMTNTLTERICQDSLSISTSQITPCINESS